MTPAIRKRSCKVLPVEAMTLASMLAALDRSGKLSATRLRDLRSAVKPLPTCLAMSLRPFRSTSLGLVPGSERSTPLRPA